MQNAPYRDPAAITPYNLDHLLDLADQTLTDRYHAIVAHADLGLADFGTDGSPA